MKLLLDCKIELLKSSIIIFMKKTNVAGYLRAVFAMRRG